MSDYMQTAIFWGIILGGFLGLLIVASDVHSRDQRVLKIRAECFRQDGYYRQFGDTAFCMTSQGHERKILWEKEI